MGTEVAKGQERVLVRHAHADGAASLPVSHSGGRGTQDECESAGPEGARGFAHGREHRRIAESMARPRRRGRAAAFRRPRLGGQHRVHGTGLRRRIRIPVDGVRGERRDDRRCLQIACQRVGLRFGVALRISLSTTVPLCHGSRSGYAARGRAGSAYDRPSPPAASTIRRRSRSATPSWLGVFIRSRPPGRRR